MPMSCLSDSVLQPFSPSRTPSVLSAPPSAMFLGPRGSSVNVVFSVDPFAACPLFSAPCEPADLCSHLYSLRGKVSGMKVESSHKKMALCHVISPKHLPLRHLQSWVSDQICSIRHSQPLARVTLEINHGTVGYLLRSRDSTVSLGHITGGQCYSTQGSYLLENINDLVTYIALSNTGNTCH